MLSITADDFHIPSYRALFEAWQKALKAGLVGEGFSLVLYVNEHHHNDHDMYAAARQAELAAASCPTPAMVEVLLKAMRIRARKRKAWTLAEAFKQTLADPAVTLEEAGQTLQSGLRGLYQAGESTMMDDVLAIVNSETDDILESRAIYLPTGLEELDLKWGGISNEGMTLVIGVSQHCKTTLMNRLWYGMSLQGLGVYLHGTESGKEQRVRDVIYSAAAVNQIEVRSAHDKEDQIRRLHRAGEVVAGFNGKVTGAGLSLNGICANIRIGVAEKRVNAAIIDYLQDIPSPDSKRSRQEWVAFCSQTFKDLSAECEIPIIVGAQAAKPSLQDALKSPRPGMWSIQWSSKPAQDAEEVFTLFNNQAYINEWGNAWSVFARPGHIELHKKKARRSELGFTEVPFNGHVRWLGETLRW